ncbi:MAG TPA: hypothetical protein VFS08_20160 [Gemmatimonadaceae bacterium]|nr:hypothetical protein [Gemmatimonadaceae bacterium]
MSLLTLALAAQLAAPAAERRPVLAFPTPGLDDSAAYQGYRTRLFRDAAGNTVQVYLDRRAGRVVHLWADAEDESIGFTPRDARGRPAILRWDGPGVRVARSGRRRTLEYRLAAETPVLHLGWFLLGSMRVERDLQYAERQHAPFAEAPFVVPELDRLLDALERLGPAARRRHLALLGVDDVGTLRARLRPRIATSASGARWIARIVQPSLDARDTLLLELRTDPRLVAATRAGDSITLRARSGDEIPVTVRIATTGEALTPLAREKIFTPDFLRFLAAARAAGDRAPPGDSTAIRARWLERQVRGVELLASREKLMAGLPTYATYFGRDMLVSTLMMRPIWRPEVSQLAIASALRKLSPAGQVSHEEALGGQAVREAAAEYAALVDAYLAATRAGDGTAADSLLERATAVLGQRRRVRENYHMIDDELQLPVLVARWLTDSTVPEADRRAFLLDTTDGGEPRVTRLLRELALVARMTAPYAEEPAATRLVSFAPRELPVDAAPDGPRWASASWRDSNAGYAGGRFAMDVNAIWVPHALASLSRIRAALAPLGLPPDSLAAELPELAADTPLGRWWRDSLALRAAIETWRGAARHFVVRLGPAELRAHVAARLAALPAPEREHWTTLLADSPADDDSLTYLALSLDAGGLPIGVANSDPATRLFLLGPGAVDDSAAAARVLRDVRLFVRDYPVGLFIAGVGPVVANDAYATPAVWQAFERDRYHGPRVVWGREVNLFLLGVAAQLAAEDAGTPHAAELRSALRRVVDAVRASGFRSELWSYELQDGRVVPVRYGSGADVQLWSTTDLAVQYALWRLGLDR